MQVAAAEPVDVAYERAFAAYWHDLFRYALAWTNDWAAAEDLTEAAYVRLWSNRERIDWERPVLPWLMVTTRRLATDRFRSLRRRFLPAPMLGVLDETVHARWLDVQAAFSTLSPLERTALTMTALGGWSYAEAAEVLESTPGALRAAVSRARDKLEAS